MTYLQSESKFEDLITKESAADFDTFLKDVCLVFTIDNTDRFIKHFTVDVDHWSDKRFDFRGFDPEVSCRQLVARYVFYAMKHPAQFRLSAVRFHERGKNLSEEEIKSRMKQVAKPTVEGILSEDGLNDDHLKIFMYEIASLLKLKEARGVNVQKILDKPNSYAGSKGRERAKTLLQKYGVVAKSAMKDHQTTLSRIAATFPAYTMTARVETFNCTNNTVRSGPVTKEGVQIFPSWMLTVDFIVLGTRIKNQNAAMILYKMISNVINSHKDNKDKLYTDTDESKNLLQADWTKWSGLQALSEPAYSMFYKGFERSYKTRKKDLPDLFEEPLDKLDPEDAAYEPNVKRPEAEVFAGMPTGKSQ